MLGIGKVSQLRDVEGLVRMIVELERPFDVRDPCQQGNFLDSVSVSVRFAHDELFIAIVASFALWFSCLKSPILLISCPLRMYEQHILRIIHFPSLILAFPRI